MNLASLLLTLGTQAVPALIGGLAAFLWFALRRQGVQQSRWWGGLAALALLAVPSVGAGLLTVFGLTRLRSGAEALPFLLLNTLLPQLIFLAFGLTIVLACFFQRHDPFRRHFAACVLAGFLARELTYLLFALGYWVLIVIGVASPS